MAVFQNLIPERGRKLATMSPRPSSFFCVFQNLIPERGRKRRGKTAEAMTGAGVFQNLIPERGRKRQLMKMATISNKNLGFSEPNPRKGTETLLESLVVL